LAFVVKYKFSYFFSCSFIQFNLSQRKYAQLLVNFLTNDDFNLGILLAIYNQRIKTIYNL